MAKQIITIDATDLMRDMKKYGGDQYPMAIARMFKGVAGLAAKAAKLETEDTFNLKTSYIPDGIRSTPSRSGQLKAAARSVERYHDLEAAVYLRPSTSAKRDLSFMVDHEDGDTRTGKGGMIAVPGDDLKSYNTKTMRGARKARWRPKALLKHYNTVGPNMKGAKLQGAGRGRKGKAFLMRTKSGNLALVRRTSKKVYPLEYLYFFKKSVKIENTWDFEGAVHKSVRTNYQRQGARYINKIKGRKGK